MDKTRAAGAHNAGLGRRTAARAPVAPRAEPARVVALIEDRLPRVETRQEFMRCLEGWIDPSREDVADGGRSDRRRGRPRMLKSYVLESIAPLRQDAKLGRARWHLASTGVPDIKIMELQIGGGPARRFFLDTGDRRFPTIHTNARLEVMDSVVDALTNEAHAAFDTMWIHYGMLESIAEAVGGALVGFTMSYTDGFVASAERGHGRPDLESLKITISGSKARQLDALMKRDSGFRDIVVYRKVRVRRGPLGDESGYAEDDIASTGYFAVRHGASVQDHLHIVQESKDMYSRTVSELESHGLGIDDVGGRSAVVGHALNFALPDRIADIDRLVDVIFSAAQPFWLAGIRSTVKPGYYRVLAVDMHTGDPITFEIAGGMMRVYLPRNGCGGTILRLLTNLQARYGVDVTCREVEQAAG